MFSHQILCSVSHLSQPLRLTTPSVWSTFLQLQAPSWATDFPPQVPVQHTATPSSNTTKKISSRRFYNLAAPLDNTHALPHRQLTPSPSPEAIPLERTLSQPSWTPGALEPLSLISDRLRTLSFGLLPRNKLVLLRPEYRLSKSVMSLPPVKRGSLPLWHRKIQYGDNP